jgi:hypothetical protein
MSYIIQEYLLPEDKFTEYLILVIALFLIIIVWAGILYKSTSYQNGETKALLTCPPGLCPTNRFTGEKRCSKNTQQALEYDPILEICNPSNSCNPPDAAASDIIPYALQTDGSTNINGNCDKDGCSCVNFLSSPSYIEVMFNFTGGSPSNSSLSILQQPSPYAGEGNNVPIVYTDPNTQFWNLNPSFLTYITPNPCSEYYLKNPELTDTDTLLCINKNPCIVGRMAYLPQNAQDYQNFSSSNIKNISIGCVPNSVENPPDESNFPNSCANSTVLDPSNNPYIFAPVFNMSSGKVHCFNTGLTNI